MESYSAVSYSALEALPAEWVGEIVDEELVASPRPQALQVRAAFMLEAALGAALERRRQGRWHLLHTPVLRLGLDVLVPDLAAWRGERFDPHLSPSPLCQAPDWVCEVLGPSTAALDRTRKLPAYARAGVAHVWLVDPLAQTLEIFQRVKRGWLLTATFEAEAMVRAEPFPSLALELGALWAEEPVLLR